MNRDRSSISNARLHEEIPLSVTLGPVQSQALFSCLPHVYTKSEPAHIHVAFRPAKSPTAEAFQRKGSNSILDGRKRPAPANDLNQDGDSGRAGDGPSPRKRSVNDSNSVASPGKGKGSFPLWIVSMFFHWLNSFSLFFKA